MTGEDEIIIQGDFTDDIIDVIQEKWPEVSVGTTHVDRSELLKQVASTFDATTHEVGFLVFYRWMTRASKTLGK